MSSPKLTLIINREPEAEQPSAVRFDDTQLLAAVRAGDAKAAGALYARSRPVVERVVKKLLGHDDQEHRDIAQQVMVEIVRSADRYRGECPFDAWISMLAARVVYKNLRHRQIERRVMVETSPPEVVAADQPAHRALLRSTIHCVKKHLDRIDPDRVWAFLLHDVHGYDLRETARIMGISVAAAQSRLVRGRNDLHERIAADPELADELRTVPERPDDKISDPPRCPEDGTPYARLAARALAAEDRAPLPIAVGDRADDVAAIERALCARAGRRQRAWWIGAAAATAAVAIGVFATRAPLRRPTFARIDRAAAPAPGPRAGVLSVAMIEGEGASVELFDGERPLTVGDEVPAGTRLRVPPEGGVTVALASGTRLDFGGGAIARVVELGAVQKFDLAIGTVIAKVAKLAAGRRFIISTPDAEVEVKGTRFEVTVAPGPSACGPRGRTRVSVQEGAVAVRSGAEELRILPGGHWPDCSAPGAAAPGAVAPPLPRAPAPRSRTVAVAPGSHEHDPAPRTQTEPASTLAEQNDLFASALAASRRGDVDEAVQWLDQIIAQYPNGPLTDSARAERRRLDDRLHDLLHDLPHDLLHDLPHDLPGPKVPGR